MTRHLEYKDRSWSVQPAAEAVLRSILNDALSACPAAAAYADLLLRCSAVRLRDIVDHVEFGDRAIAAKIAAAGWTVEAGMWTNSSGMFPPFVEGEGLWIYLKVESVERFLEANRLDASIEGQAYGPLRRATVYAGRSAGFGIVERRGYAGFEVPSADARLVRKSRLHLQAFRSRRRQFGRAEDGLAFTEALVDAAVAELGPHLACELWLSAEREYWLLRSAAGRLQSERQDAVGIGLSNIDHHTYDSSRRHYRRTIRILEKLGYELREMIYAGELAGWGSQILEQPVIGSTIFADVDLAPEELGIDFAHEPLPELPRRKRAGLVSALHGESILEAGLNHVALLFDRRALQAQLGRGGIKMMAPFSDLPHLYQQLTIGDWAPVDPIRVALLEADGDLDAAEAEKIRLEGAIISHLENIERNDGFKGFNKPGIDGVLRKLDPRAYEPTPRSSIQA